MRVPLNPWILAPLAVALGVAATVWQRGRVPTRDDWQAATDAIRAELRPGDGVTWLPYALGEGRLFFHDLPVFHTVEPAEADLARYDRVFVLGTHGLGAADLAGPFRSVSSRAFGPIALEVIEPTGPRAVGDLFRDLERVRVVRRTPGGDDVCDFWDGRGWHCELSYTEETTRACLARPTGVRLSAMRRDPTCGLNPWLHVSRDVRLIGDAPRRCVWAHPIQGATLRLEWPGAPAGEALVVEYGFSDPMVADNYAKDLRTKPAKLKVLRGEAVAGEAEIPASKGWRRLELPGGPAGPVTLEITTTSTVDAHLCVDATVRAARGTPVAAAGGVP